MRVSELVETAKSMRQSYKAEAEREPVRIIGRDTANAFNTLLDEAKKRFPENPFIRKMKPTNPGRTQLAGLLAKVGLLEDCLKAEESRLLRSLTESG